ncbi:MAG: DUF4058 family protein [Pirellulales bacterium]|nr:DUF4058 family protein [Pirellulales bacterium]
MASPFPGMDPYLELFWRDVHASLIIYARDQLQTRLPGGLRARVEERVVIEPGLDAERSVYPDIRVVERGRGPAAPEFSESGVAVAEPLVLHLPDEPATQTFIEIIDLGSGKRVVTVIEVLSLSNKLPGEGQDLYLKKRDELKQGGVSLVEIDLLRAGKRSMPVPSQLIPDSHRTPYQVCVRRGWQTATVELYRVPLRERLPMIRIPLRETDSDVPLDLQALIDQCYRNGGYDDDLDYRQPLDPPLSADDAAWADELLRSLGRR